MIAERDILMYKKKKEETTTDKHQCVVTWNIAAPFENKVARRERVFDRQGDEEINVRSFARSKSAGYRTRDKFYETAKPAAIAVVVRTRVFTSLALVAYTVPRGWVSRSVSQRAEIESFVTSAREEERVYIRERLRHDMLMSGPRSSHVSAPYRVSHPRKHYGWRTWCLHRGFHESVTGRWIGRHKRHVAMRV